MNQPIQNIPASLDEIPGKNYQIRSEIKVNPESKGDIPTTLSLSKPQNLKSVVKTQSSTSNLDLNRGRKRVSFQEDIRVFNVTSFKSYNKIREEDSVKRCCGQKCLIF